MRLLHAPKGKNGAHIGQAVWKSEEYERTVAQPRPEYSGYVRI